LASQQALVRVKSQSHILLGRLPLETSSSSPRSKRPSDQIRCLPVEIKTSRSQLTVRAITTMTACRRKPSCDTFTRMGLKTTATRLPNDIKNSRWGPRLATFIARHHSATMQSVMLIAILSVRHTLVTRATLASVGISCRRACVCPSVTSRCSFETAKSKITQTTPHDSTGTLVF